VVVAEMSVSLDGFVAGPEPSLEDPLGQGGMELHEWAFRLAAWRRPHGLEGGDVGVDSQLVEEHLAAEGAVVMGRKMFSGGEGSWVGDPNANGWWGDDPPFHVPVFVLTHHPREPLVMQGGTTFTFVTDGIASALAQARAAAGEQDVLVAGGASAGRQYLRAGLVDELALAISPVMFGGGRRLFEAISREVGVELVEAIASPRVTHVRYAVP
jgi:dihydrofolate reductase